MRSRWNVQYMQRVLATDPIAYWMQDEKQGGISYDMVTARSDGARNGAYTGVTLGQPGIGDGRTAPLFDGANDFDAIYTASMAAAFNVSEGSILCWVRVSGAGVWTDGAPRVARSHWADVTNLIQMQKNAAANVISFFYLAGGVNKNVTVAETSVNWMAWMMTWSVAADELRAYVDGVQVGTTQNGLGVWAGALNPAFNNIGARDNAIPDQVWDGWLGHGGLWNRPLSPAEIAELAVV